MKYLKRCLALALPVVAAMSLGVPASAAPSADSPGTMAVESYIYNNSGVSMGVIYDYDKPWKYPNYDAILPAYRRTDGYPLYWALADGFYVGGGWCADLLHYSASAGRWVYLLRGIDGPDWVNAKHWDPSLVPPRRYEVRQYRC